MKTNTIPINPEQFKSIVSLTLNGVCLYVMSVRDMTIFGLGVHFPKRFFVETIQSRIKAYLNTDLRRLTTIPTTLKNIHVLSS